MTLTHDTNILKRYSSLARLKHVVAYCLRLKNNSLNSANQLTVPLTIQKIVCFRMKSKNVTQLMGNLPEIRVTQARAFLNTGIDYASPFSIKISSNKTGKAYLGIFICLATKAVHLELISDLTSTAFLNALKQFISRRGRYVTLYSDNDTTFVGANNQLSELKKWFLREDIQKQIREYLLEHFIDWKLPPYSPHVGGLWEAVVKSAKAHEKSRHERLTFEKLYTILVEIEACLNSKPITSLFSNPTDLQALTPDHFLIGETITAIPDRDLIKEPSNHLNRYQLLTQMRQHFWQR